MRQPRLLVALLAVAILATGRCTHDEMTTNPGPVPVVNDIQPQAEAAGGMLLVMGTHFDQTATFDLRQGSVVKASLSNVILASGDDPANIQINGTVPAGTPAGQYQVCVTTRTGTGCASKLVGIF